MTKQFRSFKDARKFTHSLKLKNRKEWNQYCKSEDKQSDIPSDPRRVYKKDWNGMGDWLGTGIIWVGYRKFLSFKDARKFARFLKLNNRIEWNRYYKSGNKPDNIPTSPSRTYQKEWKGWGDFLGTGNTKFESKDFLSFSNARKFSHSLNLNSGTNWTKYCKSGKKPNNIPSAPEKTYKNNGWINWGDWLGTNRIANQKKPYLSFVDARTFSHSLNLNSGTNWTKYCKSGKKPNNIPSSIDISRILRQSFWKFVFLYIIKPLCLCCNVVLFSNFLIK